MTITRQPMTAAQLWTKLVAIKDKGLMERLRRYASLTIPSLLLPENIVHESTDQTHDYQSLGAQASNHITNKLMLAMFAPSRPIFRMQFGSKSKAELEQAGVDELDAQEGLAEAERTSQRKLDALGQRPKLYQIIRHLVVLGNVLMKLEKENIRVYGIEQYCVKRTQRGKMHTVVIREHILFDELDDDAQAAVLASNQHKYDMDSMVCHYIVVCKSGLGYKSYQAVDDVRLPVEFDEQWGTEAECPYHALTWGLSDKADYGTGLVEEYSGDLEALSILAEGVVDGAVLASEIRYAVDPTGQTQAQDFNQTKNGDAFPGRKEDINVIQATTAQAVKIASDVADKWEQRIGRGFLMGSAVTRNAERVTAEEIRLTAQELETALGGVYSSLGVALQRPIALWLLGQTKISLKGTDIEIEIITGLEALSRGGDLDALRLALRDAAELAALPPALLSRLKLDAVFLAIGQGHGINFRKFVMTEAEFKKAMADAVNANAANAGAQAGAVANAEQGTQ